MEQGLALMVVDEIGGMMLICRGAPIRAAFRRARRP